MTELQPQTLEGAFKIHRRLLDYWAEGSRDLELLQGLRDAYLLHPHVDEFVNVISTACFKTAALTAANFFYKEPNSIRLTYMFDFLRGMKSILTPSDFEVLRNKVGEFEVYLQKHSNLLERLVKFRHTTIAHIDRRQIFDVGSLKRQGGISLVDLELIYDFIWQILFGIGNLLRFDMGEPFLNDLYRMQMQDKTVAVYNFITSLKAKHAGELLAITTSRAVEIANLTSKGKA